MKRAGIHLIIGVLLISGLATAQKKPRTGWGWGGVPAINYNADEGFGYGIVGNIYNYSDGSYAPYYWTVQPQIFFTTGGKQEHWLWFDSPYIFGKGIRVTSEIKMLKQLNNPYYGIGNGSAYNEKAILTDEDDNPEDPAQFIDKHYYTYRRDRFSFKTDLMKALQTHPNGRPKLSVLVGMGLISTTNELNGDSSKLKVDRYNGIISQKEIDGGLTNFLKAGIVHDTRDNEPAPNCGHWTDLVVELYPKLLGSDYQYSRLTITDRRYFPVTKKIVYTQRMLFEKLFGDVPFYDMSFYGSSYKVEEGLGGSKSLRGVLKNRFLGDTKFFANLEFRFKFLEFSQFGQDFYLATNEFFDFGRVWSKGECAGSSGLHYSYGAGLHIGWNENFIIAVDMGTSEETRVQPYIGLGYLF